MDPSVTTIRHASGLSQPASPSAMAEQVAANALANLQGVGLTGRPRKVRPGWSLDPRFVYQIVTMVRDELVRRVPSVSDTAGEPSLGYCMELFFAATAAGKIPPFDLGAAVAKATARRSISYALGGKQLPNVAAGAVPSFVQWMQFYTNETSGDHHQKAATRRLAHVRQWIYQKEFPVVKDNDPQDLLYPDDDAGLIAVHGIDERSWTRLDKGSTAAYAWFGS